MPLTRQFFSNNEPDRINEHLFRLLLNFRDYAIILIDPLGKIVSWNGGAQHIYGYNEEEAIEKHVASFYHGAENPLAVQLQITQEAGRSELELWNKRKDGTLFFAHVTLTSIYSEGQLIGFAHITRDITLQKRLAEENKALNEQLEEKVRRRTEELAVSNQELEAFSYSVSHDLRAPLRAVSGYSEMLKEDYASILDDEGKRIINVILDNSKMMSDLIDDLLTFSRMARLAKVQEVVDMRELVNSCVSNILLVEKQKQYAIKVKDIPNCKGDPAMLKQVWVNLIGNAVKYSSKKSNPEIEIGFIEDIDKHVYFIKDNGAGFDMKYYNKLFGVFQRLHHMHEFEGNGLGLALVRRILTKHGGQVWGEAVLGVGATFYFSIPKTSPND